MKRSERVACLVNYFLNSPYKRIQLSYFTNEYSASKSSISEDLDIVNDMFIKEGIGKLKRVTGASGGVIYKPIFSKTSNESFIESLCEKLAEPDRILPGGYLYMSDLLGDPEIVKKIGRAFVSVFSEIKIDAVVTVETKGIPLAYAVASYLNVPVVIIRRDPKVTEGSSVSINYVSGSSRRIQTMVLSKRNLKENLNVCIIDDFMKAGGTITGMVDLLKEFNAKVVAIGVLAEAEDEEDERVVKSYTSLVNVKNVDAQMKKITVNQGSIYQTS